MNVPIVPMFEYTNFTNVVLLNWGVVLALTVLHDEAEAPYKLVLYSFIQIYYAQQSTQYTVSVLGRDEGYTVKYNPLPEGVPEGKARGNSFRQRVLFDCISLVSS